MEDEDPKVKARRERLEAVRAKRRAADSQGKN